MAEHPTAAISGQIAGAVLPGLFSGGTVTAATLPGRVVQGAKVGGAFGGLTAFGSGEGGFINRGTDALYGTAIGAALGGAIPAVADVGKHVWSAARDGIRNMQIGSDVGKTLGVSPSAGRVVTALVGQGDEPAMREAMTRAGPNAMLADANPGVAGMLDAGMRSATPGAATARARVDERAGGAYNGVMDALVGNQQGPRMPAIANQAAKAASAKPIIHPLYEEAYNTPIDYAAPAGRAIEDLVAKVPPKQLAKAVEKATDRMIFDGVPNAQIMATIGDDGAVAFTQKPNVMMLDYIKRAFDDIAEDGKDAITGKMNSDAAFAGRVARDIREATKEAVPKYGEALAAASTDIRTRAAVRTGQKLFDSNTYVEDVVSAVDDATPAELRAMREGVRAQIDHVMGNVKAVSSDQNIDARQAMKLFSDLSSPNAKQKLQALFGDEFDAISSKMDEAASALGLRARVSVNAFTQPRQEAVQMIADETAPGAVRSLQPIASARAVGQRVFGSDAASVARENRNVQGELAEILSRPGGQETLSAVVRALTANPANPALGLGTQKGLIAGGLAALPGLSGEMQARARGTRQ